MDLTNLVMIAVVMGAFWFLVIRPQQQRQKKHSEMVSALVAGMEIVTIGGIFGTVVDVGERIRIRVADGTELEIAPSAVGRVVPARAANEDVDDEDAALDSADDPQDDSVVSE